jgi:hypothetical protein
MSDLVRCTLTGTYPDLFHYAADLSALYVRLHRGAYAIVYYFLAPDGVTLLYTYTYMYLHEVPHFPWNIRIARPRLLALPTIRPQ